RPSRSSGASAWNSCGRRSSTWSWRLVRRLIGLGRCWRIPSSGTCRPRSSAAGDVDESLEDGGGGPAEICVRPGSDRFRSRTEKRAYAMLRLMADVVSLGEAARALGVSLDTLRRWDRAGKLRTTRDERNRRLVPEAEIERLS